MQGLRKVPLLAVLALCAFPVLTPAGEAPAASAGSSQEDAKKLADAQQRLDAAVREVAELSGQLGRRFVMSMGGAGPGEGPPPRALLGIGVGNGGEKDGAHVLDVSPGGPAAEAGIKPGDVITSIAGEDLTKDGNPGRALVEKMRQIDPGLKVQVAVLRGGKKMGFDVTPRPAPPDMTIRRARLRNSEDPNYDDLVTLGNLGNLGGDLANGPTGRARPAVPGGPMQRGRPPVDLRLVDDSEARFDGTEFASLSERLGSYFGVKTGVLVVRAGVNSSLNLQDGDVILAIDGREATTAQQAGRILRSYQPGEKLTLRVQRDRKAQNVNGLAPGGRRDN